MTSLPELPEEQQKAIRLAMRAAAARIQRARIRLGDAEGSVARLRGLEWQVCTSGERVEAEDERQQSLTEARDCVQTATAELFDALATQYRLACADEESFLELLPAISARVSRDISCPERAATIRGTISEKLIEWTDRVAVEHSHKALQHAVEMKPKLDEVGAAPPAEKKRDDTPPWYHNLRSSRKKQGLSRPAAARKLKQAAASISVDAIKKHEAGKARPRPAVRKAYASIYHMTEDALFPPESFPPET